MKNIILACLAVLAIGCTQQKAIVQSPQLENHRYSTVYEGNKIITYEKQLEHDVTSVHHQIITVPKEDVVLVVPKPEKLAALPTLTKRINNARRNESLAKDFKKSVLVGLMQAKENSVKKADADGGNMGFGLTGFVLILSSFILFIVGFGLAWGGSVLGAVIIILSFAAIITGIVMSIVGIVQKKSQADFVFGIVGVSIIALAVLLSILPAL
jgi:hypothetical protein